MPEATTEIPTSQGVNPRLDSIFPLLVNHLGELCTGFGAVISGLLGKRKRLWAYAGLDAEATDKNVGWESRQAHPTMRLKEIIWCAWWNALRFSTLPP